MMTSHVMFENLPIATECVQAIVHHAPTSALQKQDAYSTIYPQVVRIVTESIVIMKHHFSVSMTSKINLIIILKRMITMYRKLKDLSEIRC